MFFLGGGGLNQLAPPQLKCALKRFNETNGALKYTHVLKNLNYSSLALVDRNSRD